jgi:adenine-specific DNA-methyltransferase
LNYIGSKSRLSSWIKDEVKNVVGDDLSDKVFCDLFAGTGIVGRVFKSEVKEVISNDLEYYSFVLNKNYIENSIMIKDSTQYIEKLNLLKPRNDGFIYKHYCMGSGSNRQYFSDGNGQKIDAIRMQIELWKKYHDISDNLYYFLLASLIESADKIANTASVYGSFLKKLKKTALQDIILEAAEFEKTLTTHTVYHDDSNLLIKKIRGDILYLDPPYNQRQYSLNYHLLNTISEYKEFIPKGKTGSPTYNRSKYSKSKVVHKNFEELLQNANFKYIFLSYNSEGLMSQEEVKSIMIKYGTYTLVKKEYKRFTTINTTTPQLNQTFEYLHILEKN